MKKLISSVLILTIIITSFTISFADKSSSGVLLKESGKESSYRVVNLKIDGTTVKSADVPPIIYPLNGEGRTLVPLRMIIEHFEGRLNADIKWDQAKQEASIKTKEKEIVLKINSPDARVNGIKKRLPDGVPAKLLSMGSTSRTMVPIRFFAEELGLNVGWDEKTITALIDFPKIPDGQDNQSQEGQGGNTSPNPNEDLQEDIVDVTDIRVEMNGTMPQIRIKTLKQTDYREFKLDDPERLVIDLNNAKFNLGNKNQLETNGTLDIKISSKAVTRVRASQFEKDPSFITRIVVELGDPTDYEITFDNKTGEIVVDFINYIYGVKKEAINAKEVVIIEGDSVEDHKIMKLSNPNRLVIDIKGGVLHSNFGTKILNVDGKLAKTIRVAQYVPEDKTVDEKIVRVVVDFKEGIENEEEVYVEVKDNKLKVHLEGKPLKSIRYEETGWTTSIFTLKGLVATTYKVDRQSASNIINITVPKKDIDLELTSLNVDDHIMKSINISEDKTNYNIKLELQDSVEHKILSPVKGKDLILELNNKDAKYREILIIIDPGHGGSDPGTISPKGTKESEIVLDIALKFNKLLTEAGFRTYMTRVDNLNDNLKLTLQERTDIANALDADLFVSIHANSFTGNSVSGIETFYSSSDTSGKKLAQIIQKALINELKMIDRGAKPAGYFVLEKTTMPSALVETGFLSNSSDEAKLLTDKYRQGVAKAMFEAIIEYLETTK